MKRAFITNLFFLISINLIIKPLYIFGIDRNVQNLVGEHDYGLYFTFFSWCFILQVIGDAGLQNYNSQQIATGDSIYSEFFPTVIFGRLLSSIVFVFLVLIVALTGGYGVETYPLLFLVMAGQLVSSFVLLIRTNLSGHGYYKIDSILSALDRILLIILCAYFIWLNPFGNQFTIRTFASLQLIAYTTVLIITSLLLYKLLPKLQFKFDKAKIIKLFKSSIPYAFVILAMTIYSRSDIIILERILPEGTKQAGIYAAGYRILDALNMIGYLSGTLLLPMFARLLKSSEELKKLYMLSFNLLMVFTLIVTISLFFYRQEIMTLLYKNANAEWGDTFGLLLFSFIGTTLAYVSGCHLMACGKVTKMLRVFIIAIVINVGLNLILIPIFHVRAAAFVAAITQILILLIQSELSFREAEIQLPKAFWIRLVCFILMITAVCISVQKFLMITWYYKIVITPIFGVLIAGMFGFLSYKNIQRVVIRFFSRLR